MVNMLSEKNYDYLNKYKLPERPVRPYSGKVIDTKTLKDGSVLSLQSGASVLEFPGTATFTLRLETHGRSVSEPFLYRPAGAMLSEAAYRTFMALIETKEDFYALQKKFKSISDSTFEMLRTEAANKAR